MPTLPGANIRFDINIFVYENGSLQNPHSGKFTCKSRTSTEHSVWDNPGSMVGTICLHCRPAGHHPSTNLRRHGGNGAEAQSRIRCKILFPLGLVHFVWMLSLHALYGNMRACIAFLLRIYLTCIPTPTNMYVFISLQVFKFSAYI